MGWAKSPTYRRWHYSISLGTPVEPRVPITRICRGIELELRTTLGERDLPAPAEPAGHILL
jgi:hypothetical protein